MLFICCLTFEIFLGTPLRERLLRTIPTLKTCSKYKFSLFGLLVPIFYILYLKNNIRVNFKEEEVPD